MLPKRSQSRGHSVSSALPTRIGSGHESGRSFNARGRRAEHGSRWLAIALIACLGVTSVAGASWVPRSLFSRLDGDLKFSRAHQHVASSGKGLVPVTSSTAGAVGRSLLQAGGGVLTFEALNPAVDSNGIYISFVGQIAISLLGGDSAVLLWGTVPADSVNAACDYIVNTGLYGIPSSVTAYGNTHQTTLTVSAIGGCRASSASPVGVQAVFTDDTGLKYAVVCDDANTWTLGCGVYVVGDAVNQLYNEAKGKRRRLQACSDNRADCDAWGPANCGVPGVTETCPCMCGVGGGSGSGGDGGNGGDGGGGGAAPADPGPSTGDQISCGVGAAGAAAGGVGAALGCIAAGPFAPLCWAAAGTAVAASAVGSCAGVIADSCFPGRALVTLADGRHVPISSVKLGQEVAVRLPDGSIGFEPVYAWGHEEHRQVGLFVRLTLEPARVLLDNSTSSHRVLELSPGHFAMRAAPGGGVRYTRAAHVANGDVMWAVQDGGVLEAWRVVGVENVTAAGLFNPYTLTGTIIVNGVAASCHSEWFADSVVDALGLDPSWLPHVYQAALAPVRALWHVLGKERYTHHYRRLDRELGIAKQCSGVGLRTAWGTANVVLSALGNIVSETLSGAV